MDNQECVRRPWGKALLPLTVLLFGLFLMSACASLTGNKVELDQSKLSGIQSLGMSVKDEKGFNVRVSMDAMTNTGLMIGAMAGGVGGLVGGAVAEAVEAGVRAGKDEAVEKKLSPMVTGFNAETYLTDRLKSYLQDVGKFKDIQVVSVTDKSPQADALLNVSIEGWGLRACLVDPKMVQVSFKINSTLTNTANKSKVWERNDFYFEGRCYNTAEFEAQPDLLKNLVTSAVDNVAGRIAYEITYP